MGVCVRTRADPHCYLAFPDQERLKGIAGIGDEYRAPCGRVEQRQACGIHRREETTFP